MMKKCFTIISILLIFIYLSTIAFAQEPKYNFGSMQPAKEFSISPGDVITKLYFYNIYGNRITHISLSVSNAPPNWAISFNPELHIITVNISGITTEVIENLYVEPSEALDKIPETVPEGIEYISSSVGYIGAKPVEITISVPEDEELGKEFNITISASAEWLGQTGAVAIKQSRDFDYTIKTVPKEFREEIIEKIPAEEEKPTTFEVITGFFLTNSPWIGIIIILIIFLVYFGFIKKREFRHKRK